MKKLLAGLIALTLLAVFLPGCAGEVAGPQGQTGGTNLRLLVSDEPNDIGDFYSVNVTVSQIGFLSADTDNWTTANVSRTFDLTKLQGDNATVVWDGLVASGNYTKVFIYVDNVDGILKNGDVAGENVTVKLPSGKLQISKPFSVNLTGESSMVDFVFDITIIKAGQSGKYILKPQIGESGANQPYNLVDGQGGPPEGKGGGKPETPGGTRGQSAGTAPDVNQPNENSNAGGSKR